MDCHKCGREMAEEDERCPYCGAWRVYPLHYRVLAVVGILALIGFNIYFFLMLAGKI